MAYPSLLEDCCSGELCYQRCWVWNRCMILNHMCCSGETSLRGRAQCWDGVNETVLTWSTWQFSLLLTQSSKVKYLSTMTLLTPILRHFIHHDHWHHRRYSWRSCIAKCILKPAEVPYMHNLNQKPHFCTTVISHEITVVDIPIHAEYYIYVTADSVIMWNNSLSLM